MKYLVVTSGNPGCDYSIGCGLDVTELECESIEQAIDNALYPYGKDEDSAAEDHRIDNIEIYEYKEKIEIDLDKERKRIAEYKKRKEERETMDAELKELERLKKKYHQS